MSAKTGPYETDEEQMERECADVVPENFRERWEVQTYAVELLKLDMLMSGQTWSHWHMDFAERICAADLRINEEKERELKRWGHL